MNTKNIPYSEGTPTELTAGPFRLNRCYYMDNAEGLALLPEKSFDLCLTDPPFNRNFVQKTGIRKKTIPYGDKKKNYRDWCTEWFLELKRTCDFVFLHPGKMNVNMWHDIEHPYDYLEWIPINALNSPGRGTWACNSHPFLLFGKMGNRRLNSDVLLTPLKIELRGEIIHPCPLNSSPVKRILIEFKPASVLDIFLGSGTTAQACESLGIPWLGFEIMEEYRPDIEKRIDLGIKERKKAKQRRLF